MFQIGIMNLVCHEVLHTQKETKRILLIIKKITKILMILCKVLLGEYDVPQMV